MKDNNVYRKMDNGRYVPVGIYCGLERRMYRMFLCTSSK